MQKLPYSTEIKYKYGKRAAHGFAYGFELESNKATTYEERLAIMALYGLHCTADCTVEEEWKSDIFGSLCGLKERLQGIEQFTDITSGDNVGSHINFSLEKWSDGNSLEYILQQKSL